MMPNEAIILAGGFGTRLKEKISEIPKPMAPIQGRPFLEFLLTYLKRYKIGHVVLSVGYKSNIISDYFGEEFDGMKISYAIEKEPLGTGGGIKLAMEHLSGENTFILNGDTLFQVNLADLNEFYTAHSADLAIALKRKRDISRYGTVELDYSKVKGFREKRPVTSGLINGGVYLTSSSIFERFDLPEKFSFETDFLEKHLDDMEVHAMTSKAYFIDIGIPQDYDKAHRELPGLFKD